MYTIYTQVTRIFQTHPLMNIFLFLSFQLALYDFKPLAA